MVYDSINLTGNISKINSDEINNYIWFDICKNEKYRDKNGETKVSSSFFSARIKKDKVESIDFFKIGSWINLRGIPKSYIDKDGIKKFYILALELEDMNSKQNNDLNNNEIISSETSDRVIWHGKSYNKQEIDPETRQELENIINQYKEEENGI